MYVRTSPQRAESADGSVVEIVDRQTVRYRQAGFSALVDVEFARVTGIYPATLRARDASGRELEIPPEKRLEVITQIESGLATLGLASERCT